MRDILKKLRDKLGSDFPKIITLCGSTKFKREYIETARDEALKGHIILSVGFFTHAEGHSIIPEIKEKLDKLHKQKIDLSDEILVLTVDGYIGSSTLSEILHAKENGVIIKCKCYLVEFTKEIAKKRIEEVVGEYVLYSTTYLIIE